MTKDEWDKIIKTPEIDNLIRVSFEYGFRSGEEYVKTQLYKKQTSNI